MQYDILTGRTVVGDVQSFLKKVDEIGQSYQTTIQAVDAMKVADRRHVEYAVTNAISSFESRSNIAQNLGVEILLQLSACRQIQKALGLGVHKGEMAVLFVVIGAAQSIGKTMRELNRLIVPDPHAVEYQEAKRNLLMQTFDITDSEIRAAGGSHRIPELVRERVVLFNAFK